MMQDLSLTFVKMMTGMIVVLGLVFVFLRILLPKLTITKSQRGTSRIRLIERYNLDMRKAVYLMQIDDKTIAFCQTESGVCRLAEWTQGQENS